MLSAQDQPIQTGLWCRGASHHGWTSLTFWAFLLPSTFDMTLMMVWLLVLPSCRVTFVRSAPDLSWRVHATPAGGAVRKEHETAISCAIESGPYQRIVDRVRGHTTLGMLVRLSSSRPHTFSADRNVLQDPRQLLLDDVDGNAVT